MMKLILLVLGLVGLCRANENSVPCYDDRGLAQRCVPEFENAAFNLSVEATNTCGELRDTSYCRQTGVQGARARGQCYSCRRGSHPARYLTDFHSEERMTRWQSETMFENVQYPNSVNLTIHLGKSFEITYIRLKFYSPRPESFAIYKRTCQECPWIPYQYYSGSCRPTYNQPDSEFVSINDETRAMCTSEFSDISPLTGGNIAFSTLENRPSARNFDNSPILQDWVTATDILVMLTRLNTFGDEVFRVPNVLRSYFYAITDFSIGGRCKCNGHASQCVEAPNDPYNRLVCQCEHNTAGPDCGECQPLFNDRKWKRATAGSANECIKCNCNLHSDRCYFDEGLYNTTGSGGHCIDCRDDTAGVNCERCRDDYYRTSSQARCQPCNCDPIGSLSQQCNDQGRCQCKVGVGGDKCTQCLPNFYNFGEGGCRSCECLRAGSIDNNPTCDERTGLCNCKLHVEGRDCERCKTSYFNLQESDQYGCLPCFCHGHSDTCTSAPGYEVTFIESDFDLGMNGWKAQTLDGEDEVLVYNAITKEVGVASVDSQPIYFVAPEKYLGNKLFSYGQELSFEMRLGNDNVAHTVADLILEGDGRQISAPLLAQNNEAPGIYPRRYTFKLRAEQEMGWTQVPTAFDFQRLLANLTAIKIRATYSDGGQGHLDDVRLVSAQRSVGPQGNRANFVELCRCPEGYVGQFCESCAAGFRRDPSGSGPYTRCIPCQCNNHADYCDVETGECICNHNTRGNNCEFCERGFYGNALQGTENDCQPCPCPGGTECILDAFDEVVCTECPEGYVGNRCEYCADGFFGDPTGIRGERRACGRCYCNNNIDPNAVGNCDRFTGECLKCVFNTGGPNCEYCLPGFYGNALGVPKGEQCQPCGCYSPGSRSFECSQDSGQCQCLPNVQGRDCSECYPGYWNIDSGRGCEACSCDNVGSTSPQCDIGTGQCPCKPGVTGLRCDQCEYDHYDFSLSGCTPCECNPQGSLYANCTSRGICECQPGVIGDKCDSCEENFYNIALGCIACPVCYNLVRDKVGEHRQNLADLANKIQQFMTNPKVVNDEDFERQLNELERILNATIDEALVASADDQNLATYLQSIKDSLDDLRERLGRIGATINQANGSTEAAKEDVAESNAIIERLKRLLPDAQTLLDERGWAELDRLNTLSRNMSDQERLMLQLAQQARQLADEHTAASAGIEKTANDALELAYEALRKVQNSSNGQDLEEQITAVEDRFREAQDLFNQVANTANDCQQRAQEAAEEALKLLTKANMPIPPIDINSLLDAANDLSVRAQQIINAAERIKRENADLLAEVASDAATAADLLRQGIDLENNVARLLAIANGALGDAQDAKRRGDKTLEEAQDILDKLRGFNEKVEESKQRATEAKERIPDIERMIDLANRTALNASEAIAAAEGDAMRARELANMAEGNATQASAAAQQVKADAEATKQQAQDLNDRADGLNGNVTATMMRLNAIDAQADADGNLADTAQQKANAAKQMTQAATRAAADALDQLNMIKQALDEVGAINPDTLEELEDNILNINATLTFDLKLTDTLDEMREFARLQEGWITAHQTDLSEIRAEVLSLTLVRDSLPDFCPNLNELEPI
ncbi:laminin subunit gamma-1-like [Diadema antillarum]|uniref:laminin subunit gamma-1-like n=1 Tax=Diadema antillarum TaxID=105358 RepID=UPI003A84C009